MDQLASDLTDNVSLSGLATEGGRSKGSSINGQCNQWAVQSMGSSINEQFNVAGKDSNRTGTGQLPTANSGANMQPTKVIGAKPAVIVGQVQAVAGRSLDYLFS